MIKCGEIRIWKFMYVYIYIKRNEEEKDRLNWLTVKKIQCLFTLPFKRLNLCLGSNICLSSFVILTWRRGEPDLKSSNPSGMTRKERIKPEMYSWIHYKRNPNSTYYSTKHENQKPEWRTSTPQPNRFQ